MQHLDVIITDPRLAELDFTRATPHSAGLDLRAFFDGESITLMPNETALVSTGMRIWIRDPGYVGLISPRSGLGSKGLVLGNLTGVIDADYQGDLKVSLWNRTSQDMTINVGDRVAQLIIVPVVTPAVRVVAAFDGSTERGNEGFGSSGRK